MKNKLILLTLTLANASLCQISIVDSVTSGNQVGVSGTYAQNFDSLASSGSGLPWTDNSTILGWYSTATQYTASGSGPLASLGTTSQIDRALGGAFITFALRLKNDSSKVISAIDIGFQGEQWDRNANSPQLSDYIYTDYKIFYGQAGSISASSWVSAPNLTFASPNLAGTGTSLLNGNLPENSDPVTGAITELNLQPGDEMWIKWRMIGTDIPNDHVMGIDDLIISFQTIPEPASFAALAGLLGLGMATLRRRRS